MQLSRGSSLFIDLVRLMAAQLVVFGHGISFFGVFKFMHEPNLPWVQNIAVLVFFILSGFVIFYTVSVKTATSAGYGFQEYFIDRFSRIFAAFVPAIFFVLAIDSLSIWLQPEGYRYVAAFNLQTFIANLLMLQDFPVSWSALTGDCCTSFGSARPFWTLAVEWWFYMFFGFVALVLVRRPTRGNVVIALLLAVVPLHHLWGRHGNGLALDWMFGALMCLLLADGRLFQMRRLAKGALIVVALLLSGARMWAIGMKAYDPLAAFALATAFVYAVNLFAEVEFSDRAARWIRTIAGYSFTLYLIHYSILDFLSLHLAGSNPYVLLAAGFVLANVLSYAIGSFTEHELTRRLREALRAATRQGPSTGMSAGRGQP